jgi:hypothetical protein
VLHPVAINANSDIGRRRAAGYDPAAQETGNRQVTLRRPLAAALLVLLPLAASAAPRLEQVYPALAAADATERAILFTGDDRQAIDTFFRKRGGHAAQPKALARREPLLVRDRLPGTAAIRPLPPTLDGQLKVLPRGYERMIVGRDVVLLQLRSYTIVDIIREVVR